MSVLKRTTRGAARFAVMAALAAGVFGLQTTFATPAEAGGKHRYGVYKGPGGKGVYKRDRYTRNHTRHGSKSYTSTRWKNRNGTGRRVTAARWNRDRGLGQRYSATRRPNGAWRTTGRQVKRTGEGTYATRGWARNSRGGGIRYRGTGARTDTGRMESGAYRTRRGGSGTYEKNFERTDDGFNRTFSRTNSSGKTFGKDVSLVRDGRHVTRDVTWTRPNGDTRTKTFESRSFRR